jgi:transposase
MPYLWLTGWQHPDHNTLWRFYKEHRIEMRHLFKLTVRTAVNMDLVDMAVQAIDGTKLQANAAKDRTYDAKGLQRLLERTETVIEELEKQNEAGDDAPPVHLPEKMRQAQILRTEVKNTIERLAAESRLEKINLTDNDAKFVKSRQGVVAGYNIQTVVSPLKLTDPDKTGGMFVTAVDAVQDADDHHQLVNMLEQSEEMTGKKANITLADAGYHSGANLAACDERKQIVAIPEPQEQRTKPPYHNDFSYDANSDSYACPLGQTLKFLEIRSVGKKIVRVYGGLGAVCRQCSAFGVCTKNRYRGRELLIGRYDTLLRNHRNWMTTPLAKIAYRRRKELSEPTFGIMKEQLGFRRFLLRGLDNVRAETFLVATAFNLLSLYRVWNRQWDKTWKVGSARGFAFVSGLFLAINIYIDTKISENGVITS